MMYLQTRRWRGALLCAALLFAALALSVKAASVTFNTTVDGTQKSVSVDAFQADGEAYVSLEKLLRNLGGTTRESPGKATIDFGGRSVVITLNGTRVSTSSATFDLGHAVKEADGGPYIAVSDLGKLFSDALGAQIVQGASAAAPEAPKDVEENMDLLEEVAPPAAPAVPETPEAVPAPESPPVPQTEPQPALPPAPIGAFVVAIDPGHGGSDPGVVSAAGVSEKDIALRIALAVQEGLKDTPDIQVVLTRTEDKDMALVERAAVASQAKARFMLSIHTGASTSTAAHGFEIFAPVGGSSTGGGVTASLSTESVALAKLAEDALLKSTGGTSRGVRTAALRLLGGLAMPGLLIEVGILTTPAEENLLGSGDHVAKLAAGLVETVKQAAARAKGGQ